MNRVDKISAEMIFILAITLFLIRNLLLPLVSDDYSYAFIWNGGGGGNIAYGITGDFQRVSSIYDIVVSQWSHYFTWGGRTIAHCLIQLFVWLGKPLFDVANTLMFPMLILLIHYLANGQIKLTSKVSVIWILLGIWLCIPEWVSTMLWLTGACNYLWMAVLQLLFLVPYVLSLRSTSRPPIALMIPLGLLAGWSNEAGGFAALFLAISLIILLKHQNNLQRWAIIGLVSFIIGYLLLMLAPGNFVRANINHSDFHWSMVSLFSHLSGPFAEVLMNEAILFVPIIYYLLKQSSLEVSTEKALILIFSAAGFLVPLIMLVSPEFPLRSCFMSPILLLIASTAALKSIKLPKINKVLIYAISAVWIVSIIGALYVDLSIYRQTEERFEIISEQSGRDLIVVPPLHPSYRLEKFLGLRVYGSTAISLGGDLNRDPKMGQNVLFAKYYGLKQIATSDEVSR